MTKGKQGEMQIKMIKIACVTLLPFALLSNVYSQVWVRTYDGPADWWDKAYALTLDPSGNVLATGYVTVVYDGDTNANYCTIKYAPDGTRQWVRWHDYGFGQAIASDSNGNVYVAGTKVTIKYYANGEVSWIRGYEGYLKGSDIAVDRQGNVYVTGYTRLGINRHSITIKYNAEGNEQWVAIDSVGSWTFSIALDSAGNVYVAGDGTSAQYAVMKYSPDGQLLWRQGEDLPGYALKLAVSPGGDVYVTGSLGYDTPDIIATVKYNTDGEQEWVRTYDGPGYDIGQTLTIDRDGNCYVAGATAERAGPVTNFDYIVLKYSADGTELWQRRYTGFGADDYPFAIGVDAEKNVYVGGYSMAPRDTISWGDDYTLIKYDSFGSLQWEARYCGPDSIAGWVYALALDSEGYIYTTGFILTGTRTNYDFDWCTIKYPPTGPGISEVPNSPLPRYQRIKVYPNPARSEGLITLPRGLIGLGLYDVGGRLVKTFTTQQDRVVLAGVKPGVYLLRWQQEKEWVSTKLVVR